MMEINEDGWGEWFWNVIWMEPDQPTSQHEHEK